MKQNISLKKYNTFGIDVKAKTFISITNTQELVELLKTENDFFILSGGSNILLTKDIKKTVLHINNKGIEVIKNNQYTVYVKVNAGENWHEFVLWCLDNNFGGLENLSLIPGKVGTAPIQNIGAYGVEVKDTLLEVNTIEIKTGKKFIFENKACQFTYRDSIFKNKEKGRFVITSVVFKLTKIKHNLHYNYGAIKTELLKNNIVTPTIKDISNTIIRIRQEKLPDPKKIGNSGSFFKNPIVSESVFFKIQEKNTQMPFYKVDTNYKIPAGWLIEQCGFKGKRFGDAGVHENQALVLVNYGNANGKEILHLATQIQEKVKIQFGVFLEMEVNIF